MSDDTSPPHDDDQPIATAEPAPPPAPAQPDEPAPAPSPEPPRGPPLRVVVKWLLIFAAMLWLGSLIGPPVKSAGHRAWSALGGSKDKGDGEVHYYTCGMHPWVVLAEPGDCPICGMKLVPLDPAKFTGEVTISPVIVQNIGVRTAPVVQGELTRGIRTVGTIDYDETRVREVSLKVAGWVERLHVDYTGTQVAAGEPLFELYAPELYQAQEEYLLARRAYALGGSGPAADAARTMLDAARTKLAYYDIGPAQIAALEKRGKPAKTMVIRSPHRGVVVMKDVHEGMRVEPGKPVYRIADLSRVWVSVSIYENQLPYVKLDQTARMTLSYIPGQVFEGKVVYVYPYLDETTRQATVRLEFANPKGDLKPGMFATVELGATLSDQRVLVPRAAVIDTGERQVAFVSLGEGRFEPRNLRLGAENGDGTIEVLDGLRPGEQVVVSGQFLIDSEARMRESLARMILGKSAAGQKPAPASSGGATEALAPGAAVPLGRLLDAYLAISADLGADRLDRVAGQAKAATEALDAMVTAAVAADPHFRHRHATELDALAAGLRELAAATALAPAREALADASPALATLVRATGVPASHANKVEELHCPMFHEDRGGAAWLQPPGAVRNPYFGKDMPGCFDKRAAVPVMNAPPAGVDPTADHAPAGSGAVHP